MKISAVVNTWNEARNIARCLKSIAPYVGEIVVVDMKSDDDTVKQAKSFTSHVWSHENMGYVEPARNFALEKATGDWILLIDADEVLPESLGIKLQRLAEHGTYTYYRLPRKNLIFGRWIKHSGWWPDYKIRFFKKGVVTWSDEIHSLPVTEGRGMDLVADEKNAFTHYHYVAIAQYLERLNRYTTHEAEQYIKDDYLFEWKHLLTKPAGEFITRFYAWEGYKDGVHGLALSLLQAFSFLVVELKVWEHLRFKEEDISDQLDETMRLINTVKRDVWYWHFMKKTGQASGIAQLWYRMRAKLRL